MSTNPNQPRVKAGLKGGEWTSVPRGQAGYTVGAARPEAPDAPAVAPAVQLRSAERLLGRALNIPRWPCAEDDATQNAYFAGLEFAAVSGSASFLSPGSAENASKINCSIQTAIHGGATNSRADRDAILRGVADISDTSGVGAGDAGRNLREMLGAALTTHAGSGPETPVAEMSPHQWNQVGMRNGFADAAANWARPGSEDTLSASENILNAICEGGTDVEELAGIAEGRIVCDRNGNWVDPDEGEARRIYGDDEG